MKIGDITYRDVGRFLHIDGDPDSPYKIGKVDGKAEITFGPRHSSIEEALRNRHFRPNPQMTQVDEQTIEVLYTPEVEIETITVTCSLSGNIEDEINGV
jgi:hypothetical protein